MEQSNGQIHALIPLVIAEIGSIGKGRENKQQKYQYRGIDDIILACQPLLAKHKLYFTIRVLDTQFSQRQTNNGGTMNVAIIEMETRVFAPDGSSTHCVTLGEAADSGDKACNKAMSTALKYALFFIFCVPTEDSENDTESVKDSGGIHPEQPGDGNGNTEPRLGYRVPFGQWRQKSLEELYQDPTVGAPRLASYLTYLQQEADKKGKPISGQVAEFMGRCAEFLGVMENKAIEEMRNS